MKRILFIVFVLMCISLPVGALTYPVPDDPDMGIQNAIAITNLLNNGNVTLAKGTYYINGESDKGPVYSTGGIIFPSNVTLDLNGSTLIQTDSDKAAYSIFRIYNKENIIIKNGILIGDKNTHDYSDLTFPTHEYGFGIDIRGGTNVTIDNMDISNMTGDAVLISGWLAPIIQGGKISSGVTVNNSRLYDCRRQGISLVGVYNARVENCDIYNIRGTAPQSGIDMEPEFDWKVENAQVVGNRIHDCAGAAVVMMSNGTTGINTTKIINNHIQNNDIAGYVSIVSGKYNSITGNRIINGGIAAMDTNQTFNNEISYNTLTNSSIICNFSTDMIIKHNVLTGGKISLNYSIGSIYYNKAPLIQAYCDSSVTPLMVFGKSIPFTVYAYGNDCPTYSVSPGIKVVTSKYLVLWYLNTHKLY